MYKKITILSIIALAISFNAYGETNEPQLSPTSIQESNQGKQAQGQQASEVPQVQTEQSLASDKIESSATEATPSVATSPTIAPQALASQAIETTLPKNSNSLKLTLLPGESKVNTLVLDVAMNKDKKTTRTLLKTQVIYEVIDINAEGNYLITAKPVSMDLSYKTSDKVVTEMTSKKLTYDQIVTEAIKTSDVVKTDPTFIMVVSPRGTLVGIQCNKEKFDSEIKNIIVKNSTKTNLKDAKAADEVYNIVQPLMENLISMTLFSYPEHPVAIGQGWESNGMISPVKKYLNDAFLVFSKEDVSLGRLNHDMRQIKILTSYQIYALSEKFEYRAHGTNINAFIDEKTHWLKKADGEWLILAYAADKKGQKMQQPKDKFAIRVKVSIQ